MEKDKLIKTTSVFDNYKNKENPEKKKGITLYEYMIIYHTPRGNERVFLSMYKEIDNQTDILLLDETISDKLNIRNAFVIDYKLIRTYEKETK